MIPDVEYTNGHTFKKDLKIMTPRPQLIIFDRKEFLDFMEWVGVTGEVSTTESGEEAFTLFGNMGNIFTLDVISNPQAEWDKVLDDLYRFAKENRCGWGFVDGVDAYRTELRQAGEPDV